MNSRLQWGIQQINNLRDKYKKIVDIVENYAKQNNYPFDSNIALNAYGITIGATLLREESKWSTTTDFLPVILTDLGMLDLINRTLHTNRNESDYINNCSNLTFDLDNLYDIITKKAMYTLYYVLAIYSKIENTNNTPFGEFDEIMAAINYGLRGQDTAKTESNNYTYSIYSAITYFPKNYTINNYYNWIISGFICDTTIHSGK